MKQVLTSLDHFSIAVMDVAHATATMNGLGFICGETDADILKHFMFDNCYMEYTYGRGEVFFPGIGKVFSGRQTPAMTSFLLNGNDADAVREDFIKEGYEVTPFWTANRWAKHGKTQGMASFRAFMIRGVVPYDKERVFGVSVHQTPELIFLKDRFMHVNDVAEIDSIVYCAASDELLDKAAESMTKLDVVSKRHTVPGHYIRYATLINQEEFVNEFGVEVPEDEFHAAAIVFNGGDHTYLKARAEQMKLNHFYKGRKLYIDVREDFGLFFVFN